MGEVRSRTREVRATLLRSTPKAAGIEFRAEGNTYQCWVWGNAVDMLEDVH